MSEPGAIEKSVYKNKLIHFIITGGTIDSFYDGTIDTVTPHEQSLIPKYINSLKLYKDTKFTQVCMKDSRDLSVTHREEIVSTIETTLADKIIITHGTYTMPDTARYLHENLKRKDQVIILTGSMVPLEFINSDASFNLGFSMSQLAILKEGIYICMNGEIFLHDEAAKAVSEGRFYSIFNLAPK